MMAGDVSHIELVRGIIPDVNEITSIEGIGRFYKGTNNEFVHEAWQSEWKRLRQKLFRSINQELTLTMDTLDTKRDVEVGTEGNVREFNAMLKWIMLENHDLSTNKISIISSIITSTPSLNSMQVPYKGPKPWSHPMLNCCSM